MRYWHYLVLLLLTSSALHAAEPADPHPVSNVLIVRTAEQLHAPHVISYRLVEWAQVRRRWIVPDVGYYDTGYGKDQLWFVGAGAEVIHRPRFTWTQELYIAQESGPESHNGRALWIWPVLDMRLRPKLVGQAVAYPTIPLNGSQRWGFDVDRAKAEWIASPHWLAGAGYSAHICANRSWENEPFLTATRKTRAGDFEFWLQRLPKGAQIQVRYLFVQSE